MKHDERKNIEEYRWALEQKERVHSRIDSILRIYSVLGVLIALVGLLYFLYLSLEIRLSYSEQMALMFSGAGLLISITSWALVIVRKARRRESERQMKEVYESWELLSGWAELEAIAKSYLVQRDSEIKKHSIREVMDHLVLSEIISQHELYELENALKLRNLLAHAKRIYLLI